jgi:hypothetical protein
MLDPVDEPELESLLELVVVFVEEEEAAAATSKEGGAES